MIVIKLQKKYALKGRNKICFITVNNFEVRQKMIQFINELELVSQKGVKQKLTVNDCLFQRNIKIEQDPVNNTLQNLEHFQKFKEYLEQDKILDFKNEENNCKKIFNQYILLFYIQYQKGFLITLISKEKIAPIISIILKPQIPIKMKLEKVVLIQIK